MTGFLISLVTIILMLTVMEMVAFLWERKTSQSSLGWTLVASRRMPLVPRGSGDRGYHVLKPGSEYNWEGIPVHINSRGFRTGEIEMSKPMGEVRILNIGDSVAFGWEVNEEDTYGKQLETMLNELNDGRHYEVINAGIPGWSLPDEANFFMQDGIHYHPDVIILGLTVVNDIYPANPGASASPNLFSWLRDHTYTWPFLTTQGRFILARQVGPQAIPVLNPPQEASAYFPLDEESPVWTQLWSSIETIKKTAQEHNIPMIIVVFPTAFQLHHTPHPDLPQQILRINSQSAGIEYIDLLPIYREVCEEVGGLGCEGYENILFADVWMHPNQLGHELAARELFRSTATLLRLGTTIK